MEFLALAVLFMRPQADLSNRRYGAYCLENETIMQTFLNI